MSDERSDKTEDLITSQSRKSGNESHLTDNESANVSRPLPLVEEFQESRPEKVHQEWSDALESMDIDDGESWSAEGELPLSEVSRLASAADVGGRFRHFQQKQREYWQSYVRRCENRTQPLEENLHFFGEWSSLGAGQTPANWPAREVNTDGFYFRWNGVGIAVNPSLQFLDQFHQRDLSIQDIHLVLSTRADRSLQDTVEALYELNAQFNRESSTQHKIDYYLCAATHKELFHRLEPRYKHERHSVFSLERYIDCDEVQSYAPLEGVRLSYFYTPSDQEAGLLFELELPEETGKNDTFDTNSTSSEKRVVKLGYAPKSLWQSTCPKPLENCHLLVISMLGHQEPMFVERSEPKLTPLIDFLVQSRPKNTLLSEFYSRDGDLRLEIVKHLKTQTSERAGGEPGPILPADGQLQLEMATWRVRCAVTGNWIPAPYVHVVRRQGAFGSLVFMSSNCVL